MILLLMLALALAFTAPLLFALRRPRSVQNRREAALSLHRAQLMELARDREDGRIGLAEYQGAKLEVERRLLAADAAPDATLNGNASLLLVASIIALPIAAFALYLPGSAPNVPSEPHTKWAAQQTQQAQRLSQLIALLRAHLASVDPASANASQGQAYLAEALAEQAGTVTPEALALFKQSLAHAPANASWRTLDEQRISEAGDAAQ